MKQIASRDNPGFKQLQRLAQHAGRRGEQAILEGVHLCQAWLAQGGAPALAVFDADRVRRPELAVLLAAVPPRQVLLLESRLLRQLETVETGQGVLFLVDPPVPELPGRLDEPMVWLDRVQDPGNVGTILRVCAAAGIQRVLLSSGCAAAWSPKVLRGGQGAHFALTLHEHADLQACVARLEVPLVATTLEGAQDLYATRLPPACAWVFGHEGQGVAPALQQAAALHVRIDHAAAVESLNVAVAAALCLFEQRRQHASHVA
ncbi:MAG TPA: RNA methyltransferase [Bordetella sp.]|nr:RNA methyltransferase [Bordetella sp.]